LLVRDFADWLPAGFLTQLARRNLPRNYPQRGKIPRFLIVIPKKISTMQVASTVLFVAP